MDGGALGGLSADLTRLSMPRWAGVENRVANPEERAGRGGHGIGSQTVPALGGAGGAGGIHPRPAGGPVSIFI